jgi:hypothetical protein
VEQPIKAGKAMNNLVAALAVLPLTALFCLGSGATAGAVQLVTEQEAAYPDDPYQRSRGGPTPGPQIEIVSPALSALVKSPFHLKIRFKAHGGAAIDRDSITITYKKLPAIDVTQRINGFIHADDVDVIEAELPPGIHPFQIDVKDSRGRWAAPLFFKIGIAK